MNGSHLRFSVHNRIWRLIMKKYKTVVLLAGVLFTITIMIPTILVLPFGAEKVSGKLGENVQQQEKPTETAAPAQEEPAIEVAVYREAKESVENVKLEDYVRGVVASEMPADFEKEALKAQALTARTYIIKQMVSENKMELPDGALVADTELYQVYKSDDELKALWGADYNWKMEKIVEAVKETSGQILTYQGTPIDATFFSTSNGYTENSDAIWSNALPYLQSVASPWDKDSPKYFGQQVFTIQEFESKLGVKLPSNNTIGTITERTAGKRVAKVEIGGKEISGKDIRNKLGLKSTDFTWERKGNNIIIKTEGYGHGVGMSQYGANGMANEGKNYQDIVKYYYQGVEIVSSQDILNTITAKK
jgi:stage II sporulation protein D